jgi:hypothetical protein
LKCFGGNCSQGLRKLQVSIAHICIWIPYQLAPPTHLAPHLLIRDLDTVNQDHPDSVNSHSYSFPCSCSPS